MPRYQQSIAFQRRTTINRRLRSALCSNGDLPLLSIFKQRDPGSETVEIWRMSVNTISDHIATALRGSHTRGARHAFPLVDHSLHTFISRHELSGSRGFGANTEHKHARQGLQGLRVARRARLLPEGLHERCKMRSVDVGQGRPSGKTPALLAEERRSPKGFPILAACQEHARHRLTRPRRPLGALAGHTLGLRRRSGVIARLIATMKPL